MQALRPTLLISFAAVALIAIFLSLGFWQLQRAEERKAADAWAEERAQLSPVYLTHFPADSLEELSGRHVRVRGHYLDRQFLLDNQIHKKQVGYHVLTPFELANYEQVVLINRGWVRANSDRRQLPDVSIPDTGEIQIEGLLYRSEVNPFTDSDFLMEGYGWPQVVQDLDYERLAERLSELSLIAATVRLSEDQPHGFVREWPAPPMSAEKHTGYAVQWFAMAFAVLVLLLIYFLRGMRTN